MMSQADSDYIQIETPEHIVVYYELAGLGSRALAGLFDFVLQALFTGLVIAALAWLAAQLALPQAWGFMLALLLASSGFLAFTVYYIIAEMLMRGQSPGKRLAGLRVLSADGRSLTFLQSVLRNVLRAVDMLPFFYTVGLFAIFFSRRSQRLGDLVAGTIVIKERLPGWPSPSSQAEPFPPAPSSPWEAQLSLLAARLTPAEIVAVERFLERRFELPPAIRQQLSCQLLQRLLAQSPPLSLSDLADPESFLEALVQRWRQRPL